MKSLNQIKEVGRTLREAVVSSPRLNIVEWLKKTKAVILPERGNAFPGPVDLSRTPHLIEPLLLFTDQSVERIGLCFARQVAKTTGLFIIGCYIIDHDPGSTLLFMPTEGIGKKLSKNRFIPLINESPKIRRHLTDNPDDFQLLSYTFDRMTLNFGHAGSIVGGRSDPIRYLLKDETSGMSPGSSSDADDTTSSFWNRRIIEASTPDNTQDNIWRFFGMQPLEGKKGEELWDTDSWEPKSATTVKFRVAPCPHCNKKIQFLWRQLRWPEDIMIRDIPKQAWYECQECGKKLYEADRLDMIDKAVWVLHANQEEVPLGKWVGYHLNKMWGKWDSCSFGAVANAGLRARTSKNPEIIQKFVNNFLALPYSLDQETIELVAVESISVSREAHKYHRNTIPKECKALTIGIDVGKASASRVHYVVQGFGSLGRSWRIAWGQWDDLFQMEKYIADADFLHPSAGKMVILVGAADSRWDKPEVIKFCKKFRNRIFPIQGERAVIDPDSKFSLPHRVYYPERDDKGKPLPNSMAGYRIGTVYWKQWMYGRINCLHNEPPSFFMPLEVDSTYEKHLCSEEEYLTHKRGTNELVRAWRVKEGYGMNHYLDATLYGIAIASVFGIMNHADEGDVMTGIQKKPGEQGPAADRNPMGFEKMDY